MRLLCLVLALVAGACQGTTPAAVVGCVQNSDCEAGRLCASGACLEACTAARHCQPDETCAQGVCVPLSSVSCRQDADCKDPGVCESLEAARCEAGGCVYRRAPEGTACGEGGLCADGRCAGCLRDDDCPAPGGQHPECFVPSCQDNACVYVPQPEVVCIEAGCSDGFIRQERRCGEIGSCEGSSDFLFCNGFACAALGVCKASCQVDADCAADFFCNPAAGECSKKLDDGDSCAELGDGACASSHCAGGLCCREGDCCAEAEACPDSYAAAASCDDSGDGTTCQGRRLEKSCEANVCGSREVADDSACAGQSHACPGNLAPIACSAEVEQAAPVCPADCLSGACATGFECQPDGRCLVPVGAGEICGDEQPCAGELRCDLATSVCCAAEAGRCCDGDEDCQSFLCDTATSACFATCDDHDDSRCARGFVCQSNACVPKAANGSGCEVDADCSSGVCECADGSCSSRVCSATACAACEFRLGDGSCNGDLSAGVPSSCPAENACDGQGSCKKQNGALCTGDAQCLSGKCENADGTLDTKRCNAVACAACKFENGSFDDGTCGGSVNAGEDDCSLASQVCGSGGACKSANNEICSSNTTCASNNCDCADGSCSVKRCNQVNCGACRFDTDRVDGTCEGTLDNFETEGCSSGLECLGGACGSRGTCAVSCTLDCDVFGCACFEGATSNRCHPALSPSQLCGEELGKCVGFCECL